MIDLGTIRPGRTLRIPFNTFDKDDGSSITMTNYAVADILIYKDGSTTERASTAGFTATTDFDSKTGKHVIVIDLADNTTAGFFACGSEYLVAIDAVTVDAVTTGGWVARFRIGHYHAVLNTTIATLSTQTSFTLTEGPAEDDALNGMWCIIHDVASAVQWGWAIIDDYTGSTKTVTLAAATTFTAAATDNISVMGPMPLQPTTAARKLDVSAGGEAGVDWANVGSPTTTVGLSGTTVKTATDVETDTADIQSRLPAALVSGRMDSDMQAAANNVITSSVLAADCIGASQIAADAIGSSELAATAVSEIQSGLSTLDAAAVRAAVGLASANLDTQIGTLATAANLSTVAGYLDTEIAAILADTNELQTDWADGGRLDLLIDAILLDTGTTLDGRIPAALVGGRMDCNVGAIASETTGVAGFNRATKAITLGTVGSASTTTSVVTSSLSPAAAVTDQFKGLILRFASDTTTAALRGQATDITASTAGGVLTVTALTTAPASGDTFTIE